MEPSDVRRMIVNNYGGVRIDGTNATIIGNEPGEFIADRNNITRVWMDHAFWPFVTTKLYIDQTGDTDVLFDRTTYFKDYQSMRGTSHDKAWNTTYGNKQRTAGGQIYFGTILEHILIQNLCAFYDVGEHNEMKLHGADWNDALDMACSFFQQMLCQGFGPLCADASILLVAGIKCRNNPLILCNTLS